MLGGSGLLGTHGVLGGEVLGSSAGACSDVNRGKTARGAAVMPLNGTHRRVG